MLFVEKNGELWREVENICLCEHLFVFFFEFFVFSSRRKNVFIFFSFRSNALLLPSTSHQNPPKILPKSPKSLQQKNQQNLTKYNSPLPPYPTSLLPPYITKKYKNKNQKISPQHKIYPPKTSHQNSKQNKNPKSITPLNLYKIQNSTPKTSHPKIPKPYTTPKNYHHIPTLQN